MYIDIDQKCFSGDTATSHVIVKVSSKKDGNRPTYLTACGRTVVLRSFRWNTHNNDICKRCAKIENLTEVRDSMRIYEAARRRKIDSESQIYQAQKEFSAKFHGMVLDAAREAAEEEVTVKVSDLIEALGYKL